MAEREIDPAIAVAGLSEPARLDPAAIADYSRRREEPAAAAVWRREALAVLGRVHYPDRVQHLWRYTDPDRLRPRGLLQRSTAESVVADLPDGPAVLLLADRPPQLNAAAAGCGLVIAPLFADPADLELAGRAVPAGHGYFEALNAVAWNAGLVIRAPRGLALRAPLRVIVPAGAGGDVLPRVLVVAAENSAVTIVEEHTGGGPAGVVIGVTEILAAANSDVRHVLVQRWADGQVGHLTQRTRVERDARFLGATAGFGGSIAKLDLGAQLVGPGARSELVGVALPERRQHLDHHTVQQHASGRTWSNIDFKAAVADRARSVYTGLIRIEKDAPGSEAFQENRNLLLAETARADTIPELEILTDDVRCSHGATVAPVDPEQLFYLQSRGLAADESLRLVVRGFVEPTLRQVPEDLRQELAAMLAARLQRLGEGR